MEISIANFVELLYHKIPSMKFGNKNKFIDNADMVFIF